MFMRTAGGMEERRVDVDPRPGLTPIEEMRWDVVEGDRVPEARSCCGVAVPAA